MNKQPADMARLHVKSILTIAENSIGEAHQYIIAADAFDEIKRLSDLALTEMQVTTCQYREQDNGRYRGECGCEQSRSELRSATYCKACGSRIDITTED